MRRVAAYLPKACYTELGLTGVQIKVGNSYNWVLNPQGSHRNHRLPPYGITVRREETREFALKPLRRYGLQMRIALFQPDIPQNAGAIFRLGACLNVPIDIIEPCGFVLEDRRLKRVAMDYGAHAVINRHASWEAWLKTSQPSRTVLLTTQGSKIYTDFSFRNSDILLVGRESAGVPSEVHSAADARLAVPMVKGARSLNVATTVAMVLGEALRQTGNFS